MTRSCEEDPPFDYLLVLALEATGQDLTVLPTHRLLRDLGPERASDLLDRAGELFEVEPVSSGAALATAFGGSADAGGRGRLGLWTRAGGAVLKRSARRSNRCYRPAVRRPVLDVTMLGAALRHLVAIDDDAIARGAVEYTKSVADALTAVDADNGIDAAFLLETTPVSAIRPSPGTATSCRRATATKVE